jgi:hypothetical protein
MVDEWNKKDGELEVDAEVTVNGELYIGEAKADTEINKESYWAKVIRHVGGVDNVYVVEDDDGKQHEVPRENLRHRKRHVICCGHVSDDKRHDRFAMQHFTNKEFIFLEQYMNEHFPNDLINGQIKRLHQHSDNATQHFKSTGALEYFTSLIIERGGPGQCMYVYSFGAPGHGKGVFDGVGGTIKNKISSLIKATKTSGEGVPGVESRYITDVNDVFQAIQHYFEKGDNRPRTRAGSTSINKYKFFSHLIAECPIPRPAVDEVFDPLEGISSNYQYAVNNVGIVYKRKQSCWCMSCMTQIQSTLRWGETHAIPRCLSRGEDTTKVYDFVKQSCRKRQGVGVAAANEMIRVERNEIAEMLNVGDWMMFASPQASEPFWIGRAIAKTEWGDRCSYKNNTPRQLKTPGIDETIMLRPGEYAINVQWYCQYDIGNPLKYCVEAEHPYPVVNHYNDLVMGGFDMVQTVGRSVRVPRQRTVRTRNDEYGYAHPTLNLQTREGDWFRREHPNTYTLSEDVRDRGIAMCSRRR